MEGEALPFKNTNSEEQDKMIKFEIEENRPKFGKMVVLFNRGSFVITIGPDYLCFIPTFCLFLALSYFLMVIVKANFTSPHVILFAYGVNFIQCGSYLFVALSNPSISPQKKFGTVEILQRDKHKVCRKCGAQKNRNTVHCRQCDVCIEDYDHHCPWISKCIGKGNLWAFYFFITSTPIYIFCFIGLMMVSLTIAATSGQKHLTTHL